MVADLLLDVLCQTGDVAEEAGQLARTRPTLNGIGGCALNYVKLDTILAVQVVVTHFI